MLQKINNYSKYGNIELIYLFKSKMPRFMAYNISYNRSPITWESIQTFAFCAANNLHSKRIS